MYCRLIMSHWHHQGYFPRTDKTPLEQRTHWPSVRTFLFNYELTRSKRSSTHAGLLLWWKQPPHKQHMRHHAFHYLHLLKRKKGGEASTKAQLSYILTPRYFCLSLHSVRSFNRKQGALKCCSTTTAHWWPMEGGGMPLVSLNNCDTIHTC